MYFFVKIIYFKTVMTDLKHKQYENRNTDWTLFFVIQNVLHWSFNWVNEIKSTQKG